jgi:hypothetical protein
VVVEGLLDSPRGGGSNALVDRECLSQVRGGLARAAVVEVAVADSFRSAGFFNRQD